MGKAEGDELDSGKVIFPSSSSQLTTTTPASVSSATSNPVFSTPASSNVSSTSSSGESQSMEAQKGCPTSTAAQQSAAAATPTPAAEARAEGEGSGQGAPPQEEGGQSAQAEASRAGRSAAGEARRGSRARSPEPVATARRRSPPSFLLPGFSSASSPPRQRFSPPGAYGIIVPTAVLETTTTHPQPSTSSSSSSSAAGCSSSSSSSSTTPVDAARKHWPYLPGNAGVDFPPNTEAPPPFTAEDYAKELAKLGRRFSTIPRYPAAVALTNSYDPSTVPKDFNTPAIRTMEENEDLVKPIIDHGEVVLEVECGTEKGLMYLSKLCQGSKGSCIWSGSEWYAPNEFQHHCGRESAKDWKRSIRHHGKSLKLLLGKGILSVHPTACECIGCKTPTPIYLERIKQRQEERAQKAAKAKEAAEAAAKAAEAEEAANPTPPPSSRSQNRTRSGKERRAPADRSRVRQQRQGSSGLEHHVNGAFKPVGFPPLMAATTSSSSSSDDSSTVIVSDVSPAKRLERHCSPLRETTSNNIDLPRGSKRFPDMADGDDLMDKVVTSDTENQATSPATEDVKELKMAAAAPKSEKSGASMDQLKKQSSSPARAECARVNGDFRPKMDHGAGEGKGEKRKVPSDWSEERTRDTKVAATGSSSHSHSDGAHKKSSDHDGSSKSHHHHSSSHHKRSASRDGESSKHASDEKSGKPRDKEREDKKERQRERQERAASRPRSQDGPQTAPDLPTSPSISSASASTLGAPSDYAQMLNYFARANASSQLPSSYVSLGVDPHTLATLRAQEFSAAAHPMLTAPLLHSMGGSYLPKDYTTAHMPLGYLPTMAPSLMDPRYLAASHPSSYLDHLRYFAPSLASTGAAYYGPSASPAPSLGGGFKRFHPDGTDVLDLSLKRSRMDYGSYDAAASLRSMYHSALAPTAVVPPFTAASFAAAAAKPSSFTAEDLARTSPKDVPRTPSAWSDHSLAYLAHAQIVQAQAHAQALAQAQAQAQAQTHSDVSN